MKFTCAKDDFSRGIAAVQRVVSTRGPLPILSNLLLATAAGELKISATDLDVGIEAKVPAAIRVEGAVTLAAKQLSEIVNKLPNSEIAIAAGDDGGQVTVTCERSRFVLPVMPAEEFPHLPALGDEGKLASLPASQLARAIRETSFAASRDDKSIISGLLLRLHDGNLEMVATDGFRLTWWRWEGAGAGDLDVIVPARAMNELGRLLAQDGNRRQDEPTDTDKGAPGQVTVGKAGNQIMFAFGDSFLVSRTIDGAFPSVAQIVPASFLYEAHVDRSTLLGAVERAAIMAPERDGKSIRLTFAPGDLRIWARASELGEVDEHLPIDYNGEPLDIIFNARYLEEALKALEGETVAMRLNGSVKAAQVLGAEPLYYSLLMPIRS